MDRPQQHDMGGGGRLTTRRHSECNSYKQKVSEGYRTPDPGMGSGFRVNGLGWSAASHSDADVLVTLIKVM